MRTCALGFDVILRNELLDGAGVVPLGHATHSMWLDDKVRYIKRQQSVLQYSVGRDARSNGSNASGSTLSNIGMSPLSMHSQCLLVSPRKTPRKIAKVPFKVLDAPDLQDDFYLNLVDWSQQNVLVVALGASAYLYSACTSQVTKLCDLTEEGDAITSVNWIGKGNLLAVGTNKGFVQIWDVQKGRRLRSLTGHSYRVGVLAAKGSYLASGSRDRNIIMRDIRVKEHSVGEMHGHRQEVCGLKWAYNRPYLASGGNDNRLLIWDVKTLSTRKANASSTANPDDYEWSKPYSEFKEHEAAVKAIAWSPHQAGLLASGGGTADRCIRTWNVMTEQPLQCVDTGSQVCNIAWSKTSNEIVSTHGYSQNQIVVWKYPSMAQVAKLTGHTFRVLYLAMSPDGQTIVTGAGDETLRFWNVFNKCRAVKSKSVLELGTASIR
ncbi:fizzy-like protein [Sphaeroforma arctica JP610]|uniref:Fizzy-like protein n=1 Tax=Sphaeroforma arctica JP610 TaxID=667725 RepID=A0A0L0GC17_9EUKA|nr:fizzy-like protein [Sphaeroforma arctica JP610]KNC85798.1 fizzy-like protein [Sphaeroforma arctica JP610]|eukprot:XP_014159700.1 fizzy-like protein [Sphaeroforma arctica JP610]